MSKRSHHHHNHHHHHHHHPQQHGGGNSNNNTNSIPVAPHNHSHTQHNGSPFPPLGLAAAGAAGFSTPSPGHSPLLANGSGERAARGVGAAAAGAMGAVGGYQGNSEVSEASHKEGLPPAPQRVDAVAAQQCRLQDAYWSDDEEDMECPLCLEEIDLSDANFKPCPCGYQICRFCWHHIKQNLNGRCPACRRKYSDQSIEFKPMSAEEIKRLTQAKKQKEREKKELENMNRKHLANMRVVQKNLVYVVGLSSKLAKEELIPTLRSNEYFGQYGRISKILISKRTTASKLVMGTSESNIGVYVTYHRKEDAARAIVAIDGSKGTDGKILRASYGTTKYCTTYLRNLPCTNPACTYLHEPGEEADSFTKEDLSTLRHAAKDMESKGKSMPASSSVGPPAAPKGSSQSEQASSLVSGNTQAVMVEEPSALPKTASWASSGRPALTPVNTGLSNGSYSGGLKDADMPPLSVSSPVSKRSAAIGTKTSGRQGVISGTSNANTTVNGSAPASIKVPVPSALRRASQQPLREDDASEETHEIVTAGMPSALPAPPGLTRTAAPVPSAPSSPPAPRSAASPSATPSTPLAPPGLGRTATGPPPGLVTSSPKPSTQDFNLYQPSASAQALLDDMRHRRAAAETAIHPHDSPFPDFDYTLSRFDDGDFSFNLPAMAVGEGRHESGEAHHLQNGSAQGSATLTAFTSFATEGASRVWSGLDLSRADSRQSGREGSSPSASGVYSGPFDPFASGYAWTALNSSADIDDDGPFRAIDEMRRELSEDGHEVVGETSGNADVRTSRFDFAKRDPVSSGASPALRDVKSLRPDLYNDRDPLALSKDVSVILGNVFDQEAGPMRQDIGSGPLSHGAGAAVHRETNIYGRATQAQAQAAQQAHVAQLPQVQPSHTTVPPRGPPGLSAAPSFSSAAASTPTPHPSVASNNWYHDLQQQRAQQQQNGAYTVYGEQQLRGPNGGTLSSEQTLLAQIMAGGGSARRNVYTSATGDISGGYQQPESVGIGLSGDLPFFDPAIMSMTRQQQAQAQAQAAHQHQHQQQQQRAAGGGQFLPFGEHGMPHQMPHHQHGGAYNVQGSSATGDGNAGGGIHQGSASGGYRSPYSTMS